MINIAIYLYLIKIARHAASIKEARQQNVYKSERNDCE